MMEADNAGDLVVLLYGKCLRYATSALGRPMGDDCNGLSVAARRLAACGRIDDTFKRKLINFDVAYHIVRHMTSCRADKFYDDLQVALGGDCLSDPPPPPPPPLDTWSPLTPIPPATHQPLHPREAGVPKDSSSATQWNTDAPVFVPVNRYSPKPKQAFVGECCPSDFSFELESDDISMDRNLLCTLHDDLRKTGVKECCDTGTQTLCKISLEGALREIACQSIGSQTTMADVHNIECQTQGTHVIDAGCQTGFTTNITTTVNPDLISVFNFIRSPKFGAFQCMYAELSFNVDDNGHREKYDHGWQLMHSLLRLRLQ